MSSSPAYNAGDNPSNPAASRTGPTVPTPGTPAVPTSSPATATTKPPVITSTPNPNALPNSPNPNTNPNPPTPSMTQSPVLGLSKRNSVRNADRGRSNTIGEADAEEAPTPVPPPDVIAFFDPASTGGGGPLRRITTAQRKAEAEAREREALQQGAGQGSGQLQNRQRSGSHVKFAPSLPPTKSVPLKVDTGVSADNRDGQLTPVPDSPAWSGKTLSYTPGTTPGEKDREFDFGRGGESHDGESMQLAPEEYVYPDGGYGWVVVGCCATLAGLTMGWGMNYGVFQEYYAANQYKGADSSVLSLVGTCQSFLLCAAAFLSGRLGDKYGFKLVLSVGAFICWVGLFSASFCTQLPALIICEGAITGFGQGTLLPLFMSLPSQWFYKRRGLASGITLGGAGLGGGASTLIVRQLLTEVGSQKTLLIMSFVNAILMVVAILLIRTRPSSPEASGGGKGPWIDKNVFKQSSFWALGFCLLFSVTAYSIPFVFLAQWTSKMIPGLTSLQIATPLTVLAFSITIGRAIIGFIADKLGPLNTFIIVIILSGVTQYALWLTATTFGGIIAFCVVYGLVAPGYLGLMPQIVVTLFGPTNLASNVGIFLIFNSPGNLIGGPIGGALYDATGETTYKWMIIVMGALQILGGVIACWARYKAAPGLFARI